MKNKNTTSYVTRRSALGLFLAGIALPASRARAQHAGRETTVFLRPEVNPSPAVLASSAGEPITALFASEFTVGASGWARGYLNFDFGGGRRLNYVADRGGLDLDEAGAVSAVRILMYLTRSLGRRAQDYALLSVSSEVESTSEPCLIYSTVGGEVYDASLEPVHFAVRGAFTVRRG